MIILIVMIGIGLWSSSALGQNIGINKEVIRVGATLNMSQRIPFNDSDLAIKAGIEAAFQNAAIRNRKIEYVVINDSADPRLTVNGVQQLVKQGIFVMLGSSGSSSLTTQAALPILAEYRVPAVGFVSGADVLRAKTAGVINFRASYAQEVNAVAQIALASGVQPTEICFFVQNDAWGMSAVRAVKTLLEGHPAAQGLVHLLDQIIGLTGRDPPRNGRGPVGVYSPEAVRIRDAYQSLQDWQKRQEVKCRLLVTMAIPNAAADLLAQARRRGENWIMSSVSTMGAELLGRALAKYNITNNVIITQVVPDPTTSDLPIVVEARRLLDNQLSYLSLEGFIVGKLFLALMQEIRGDLTRENFLRAAHGRTFNLGGLIMDFSNDNQASDFVQLTLLSGAHYVPASAEDLQSLFQ